MTINKPLTPIDGQQFYSKRNQVFYVAEKDCVRKKYLDQKAYSKELWVYERLLDHKSVKVPKLISRDDTTMSLDLSFIQGSLLLDQLILCERGGDVKGSVGFLGLLYDWMYGFYEAMGGTYTLNDVNLRNFIIHEEGIYGLDFEMVTKGNRVKEECMVLAMYQMYKPEDTDFKEQVSEAVITKHFNHSDDVYGTITSCREVIEKRRKSWNICDVKHPMSDSIC